MCVYGEDGLRKLMHIPMELIGHIRLKPAFTYVPIVDSEHLGKQKEQ